MYIICRLYYLLNINGSLMEHLACIGWEGNSWVLLCKILSLTERIREAANCSGKYSKLWSQEVIYSLALVFIIIIIIF